MDSARQTLLIPDTAGIMLLDRDNCTLGIEGDACVHSPATTYKPDELAIMLFTLINHENVGRSMTGRSKVDKMIYERFVIATVGLSRFARLRLRRACVSGVEQTVSHSNQHEIPKSLITLQKKKRTQDHKAEILRCDIRWNKYLTRRWS